MSRDSGRYDAVVLGATPEGLAAALELAAARRRVLVLEAGPRPGGPWADLEFHPGFRADAAFEDAGALHPALARWLPRESLLRPELALLSPWAAGGPLAIWRDATRTATELADGGRRTDADRWPDFCRRIETFTRLLSALYQRPAVDPAGRLVGAEGMDLRQAAGLGGTVLRLGRRRLLDLLRTLPMSAADWLEDELEDEDLRAALLGGALRGVFQGPRSGGTAATLLHHAIGLAGCPAGPRALLRGGAGALGQQLADAARQQGVEIRCDCPPARILTDREGRVRGVGLAGGGEVETAAVLSALHLPATFGSLIETTLLPPDYRRALRHVRHRGAWSRVHLALAKLPEIPGLDRARPPARIVTPLTTAEVERAWNAAKHGGCSPRPWLELSLPSLHEEGRAPAGAHLLSITVRFTPYQRRDAPWNAASCEALGDSVAARVEELLPGTRAATVGRSVLGPRELEQDYGLPEGSEEQGELALDQMFFLRPVAASARHRTPVPGLLLCGPATHPGGGLTGGSGILAARSLLRRGA